MWMQQMVQQDRKTVQKARSGHSGEMPGGLRSPTALLLLPRSVKNGAQTRVDICCTYQQSPSSSGLSAKLVFHELSKQTRGITRLGPYALDKDSLYLNGE